MPIYNYLKPNSPWWLSMRVTASPEEIEAQLHAKWYEDEKEPFAPGRSQLFGKIVELVRFPDGRVWDAYFRGWRDDIPMNTGEAVTECQKP